MAKRRISQQQSRRISAAQEKKLEDAGDLSGELSGGLVIARYGKRVLVEDASSGEQRQCFIRPHIDNLVAGDRVAWRASENEGVIEALEDRSTVLTRTSPHGDLKPIAANATTLRQSMIRCAIKGCCLNGNQVLPPQKLCQARLTTS